MLFPEATLNAKTGEVQEAAASDLSSTKGASGALEYVMEAQGFCGPQVSRETIDAYADVIFVRAMIAGLFLNNLNVGVVLLTLIATCFSGNFPGEVN